MFGFRIIVCADGNQVIDMSLKTPYESLTFDQMIDYMEVSKELAIMGRMKRKAQREAEQQRKLARNPFYRLACLFGMV